MLAVYLDQNHWIGLLKAEQGHPGGESLVPVLADLRARRGGSAFFPISSAHVVEMHKISDPEKRATLGSLMFDLSLGLSLLPGTRLYPMELDRSLQAMFGKPTDLRTTPIFGFGLSHAFGFEPPTVFQPPEGIELPPGVLERLQVQHRLLIEQAMFTNPPLPPGYEAAEQRSAKSFDEAVAGHFDQAISFVDAAEEERRILIELGYDKGERLESALVGRILTETPHLVEALRLAGIGPHETEDLGADGWRALLDGMPSSVVTLEMRRFVQSQSERRWTQNDLVDLAALSIAIPYCDLVVTERQWAHMAKVRGLSDRFGTTVLSDLQELPAAIEEVRRSRGTGPAR